MSDVKKIFTLFIIFIMLFNPVLAADTGQQKEKVIDGTKEKETKITNKDKSITGDIKVTTKDVSKFSVKKKSNYEISISKSGEHAKAKVSFPKSELQKIDIDKDGKFGLLHISDTGEVTHTTATEAELIAGKELVFSENIVNGYSGYKQYTFSDVESGDTLNIEDVSGNYTVGVAVDGVVPTYTAGIPTSGLWAHYNFNINANDSSGNENHGTSSNVLYVNGGALFNGSAVITVPDTNFNDSFTVLVDVDPLPHASGKYTFFSQGRPEFAAPYNGFWITTNSFTVSDSNTAGIVGTNIYDANRNTWTYRYNGTRITTYKGLSALSTKSTASVPYMGDMLNNAKIGRHSALDINYMNGTIYDLIVYETPLNLEKITHAYAGGSGISFRPEPSYNFTGYNVAPGVEKVLNTDSTCTGIEYVDTTGGTHDVTVTVYFTKDTTVISDSHTATMQTVNISHTSSNTAQDGELIPYDILDEYFGTIGFDTTNPNATITRNATHFMVNTGYITANNTYYYNVSIPNYIEEMLWYDWDPTNETCNAKVQIGNSTPYTTWNITTTNVTNGSLYKIVYAGNGTEAGNATAVNGSASIIIVGLVDGVYWLTETPVLTGFVNVPAVAVVIIGAAGAFVGGSFINKWYRRRRGS